MWLLLPFGSAPESHPEGNFGNCLHQITSQQEIEFHLEKQQREGKTPARNDSFRTKGCGAQGVVPALPGEEKIWDFLELEAQGGSGIPEILWEFLNPTSHRQEMIIFGIMGSCVSTSHLLGYFWKDSSASLEFQLAGGGSKRSCVPIKEKKGKGCVPKIHHKWKKGNKK